MTDGAWRRASFCASGECAEVRAGAAVVAVRDSGDPAGPVLAFTREAWAGFIAAVKAAALP